MPMHYIITMELQADELKVIGSIITYQKQFVVDLTDRHICLCPYVRLSGCLLSLSVCQQSVQSAADADWLTDWLTDRQRQVERNRLTDWLTDRLTGQRRREVTWSRSHALSRDRNTSEKAYNCLFSDCDNNFMARLTSQWHQIANQADKHDLFTRSLSTWECVKEQWRPWYDAPSFHTGQSDFLRQLHNELEWVYRSKRWAYRILEQAGSYWLPEWFDGMRQFMKSQNWKWSLFLFAIENSLVPVSQNGTNSFCGHLPIRVPLNSLRVERFLDKPFMRNAYNYNEWWWSYVSGLSRPDDCSCASASSDTS